MTQSQLVTSSDPVTTDNGDTMQLSHRMQVQWLPSHMTIITLPVHAITADVYEYRSVDISQGDRLVLHNTQFH